MSENQTKRLQFDSSAVSPADKAKTPLASARQTFKTTVASLQPELATILDRLANDLVTCLHRQTLKEQQVSEYESDEDKIPRSAKVKFDLQGSKLVEQDKEFQDLKGETDELVKNFRKVLAKQVMKKLKIEVKYIKKQTLETFATHLRMAVKAILTVENNTKEKVDMDKFVATLLTLYKSSLLTPLKITTDDKPYTL